uniref:Uncharacterized protein n=1 Tax=Pyxicephalus adspersus TaxID=30357 RepID=A0AAV3ATP4_PYXAD|nr:TPA: hypothetical protein GDO54_010330 [Pyxicephalus adspersus]
MNQCLIATMDTVLQSLYLIFCLSKFLLNRGGKDRPWPCYYNYGISVSFGEVALLLSIWTRIPVSKTPIL